MSTSWKDRLPMALGATLLAVALVIALGLQPARAQREGAGEGSPRYTVGETQGHNLIVVDNKLNLLYFYTVDKDAKVGSDLKLRGAIDLNQVGKPVIRPVTAKSGG
jgi:hypothetical protein